MTQELSFNSEIRNELQAVADAIRALSIDAVEAAGSGHPGLPLGAAQIGAYLYGYFLRHYPKASNFIARDRFILSAGHGSMLLYSCLHLSGFDLSLEDIKRFRQLGSKTPGHPEYRHTDGVETTTGPLGQGLAAATGQAIAAKLTSEQLGLGKDIYDPKIVVLAGDGCMMEGISHEAMALAGHLKLSNLIVIYDANDVCLDGPLNECASEDVAQRFKAYGFDVVTIDGHNFDQIHHTLSPLRENQKNPTLIIARTVIGYGSPNKQGTSKAHGSPLGSEETRLTKKALGLNEAPFFVDDSVRVYFEKRLKKQQDAYFKWLEDFEKWKSLNREQAKKYEEMIAKILPHDLESSLRAIEFPASVASRSSSNSVIAHLASSLPWIVGGSADLSCSDSTWIKSAEKVSSDNWKGRNIKYGVREFAMASCASGIAQSHFWLPFVGTFLTFSDYMRNAIRLSALMKTQVIYQFTHDSVFLGEDGPTHQPIEHFMALRAMPNLQVIRPADAHEVAMGWLAALKYEGPTALILSRQSLPTLKESHRPYSEGMGRGGYILKESSKSIKWVILATGSEVSLALDVMGALEEKGIGSRVVSLPCFELFDAQSESYRKSVLEVSGARKMSIESGTSLGWHRYVGLDGLCISIDEFGQSAKVEDIKSYFGFTPAKILERMKIG